MTKFKQIQKIAAAFLFAFGCSTVGYLDADAQVPFNINPVITPETISESSMDDSLNIVDNSLDSLMNGDELASSDIPSFPVFPDSVYESRIMSLPTVLPVTYNEQVRNFINMYTMRAKKRDQVERMVGLSKIYFPLFEQILSDNQVPTDLKYLAIIESALNPHAVSHCGATGIWQFMYSTGKIYGLQINGYLDERKDIIESTKAAATYLKNMYNTYGDWLLSIAAYNCGPGNVNRAILRSGGSYDFWTISKYLPKETRGYVPAFIAAMYVMNYYDTHGLYPQYPEYCIGDICTVDVSEKISFEQLSKLTCVPIEEIRFLNPALRGDVIPALGSQPYSLKLPSESLPLFSEVKDSIVFLSKNYTAAYYSKYKGHYYNTSGKGNVHIVRKGETLGIIAQRHKCSVAQIKSWNNLKGNTIYAGQKLKVYGGNSVSSTVKTVTPTVAKSSSTGGKVVYYKVRSGDTLWGISNLYPGVTVSDIKAANDISKVHKLQPGTVLKINL